MGQKTENNQPDAVLDEQSPAIMRKKNELLEWLLAAVVLISVVAAGNWVFQTIGKQTDKKELPQLSNSALITKVNELGGTKDYDKAKELIAAQKHNDPVTKAVLTGSVQQNAGDDAGALATYKDLIATGKATQNVYENAAYLAAKLGDKKLAISYYQRAIKAAQADKSNPVASADIAHYQTLIEELQ